MKYKYVPVEGMNIWQLGQAVEDGGEFYDESGELIYLVGFKLNSSKSSQYTIGYQLGEGKITTREPVQWYDELPKLVKIEGDQTGLPSFAIGINKDGSKVAIARLGYFDIDRCTPLTAKEAAEFGVEL